MARKTHLTGECCRNHDSMSVVTWAQVELILYVIFRVMKLLDVNAYIYVCLYVFDKVNYEAPSFTICRLS